MKKCILLVFLIGFCSSASFVFYKNRINLQEKNQKLYQDFREENLVDVTGKINLTAIKSEKKQLETELKTLFEQEKLNKENNQKKIEELKQKNNELQTQTKELSSQIINLEAKKEELSNQYNILENKYKQLQNNKKNNNTNGFPLINQYPKYPTGCESVALTMLLRYYGINVSPDDIISKLKKESLPYYENGVRYGGNPEIGFIGNPYSSSSFGVFEKPIANVANMYKSGIQIKNNFSFQEVLNLAKKNHPVLVWTSMGLSVPYISQSWIYKPTMETIYWKTNEHVVVIVSSDDSTVTIADPTGGKLKTYSVSLFEERYNYYGRKALYYL